MHYRFASAGFLLVPVVVCLTLSFGAEAATYSVVFVTDGTAGATLTGALSQDIATGGDCSAMGANAPSGFAFIKWMRAGVDYSTANPLTVTNVTAGMTLTAVFATVIEDMAELQSIGVDAGHPLSGSYCLTSDLGATDEAVTPVGSWENVFTGKFFGNCHSITGLTLDSASAVTEVGLFCVVGSGAEIHDLNLLAANITTTAQVTGTLAGLNRGLIDHCRVSGSVVCSFGIVTGGLVGNNNKGTITDCHATVDVQGSYDAGGLVGEDIGGTLTRCHAAGTVQGTGHSIGGLVGDCNSTELTECYATGDVVSRKGNAGGLVGNENFTTGTTTTFTKCFSTGRVRSEAGACGAFLGSSTCYSVLTDCFAVGTINGASPSGGLLGFSQNDAFSNCYWDTVSTGLSNAIGGAAGSGTFGRPTSDMVHAATFADWNIGSGSPYTIVEGKTYPYLAWMPPTAVIQSVASGDPNVAAFTVTFSMPVPGFDSGDLDVSCKGLTEVSRSVAAADPQHADVWDVRIAISGADGSIEVGVNVGGVIMTPKVRLGRDVTPPTGTIVINNNRSAINSPNVTLSLTWDDDDGDSDVSRMRFSDDGAHWSCWEPLAATRAYTLPPGPDGHRTVRVQFLDRANNRSLVYSDYIFLDTTPPTGGIVINGGAATTISLPVSLGLSWSDGAGVGVSRMRFSDDGAHWTSWETPTATRGHMLPAGLGNHTVRVQYSDGLGNYSAAYNDYTKVITSPYTGTTNTMLLPGNAPLVMVWIQGGSYLMGSSSAQHAVSLDRFWIAKYELTRRQWTAAMGTTPWNDQSNVRANPDAPAVYVSWNDAQSFFTALNAYTGNAFRLPSEAEWEYACRAGTTTRYYWGDDPSNGGIMKYAFYSPYAFYAHVVGQKLPNAFGLFDMSGNAWEWCEDDWHADYTGAPTGGQAWVDTPRNSDRVLRGGSWNSPNYFCASAYRNHSSPDTASNSDGFRVAQTP